MPIATAVPVATGQQEGKQKVRETRSDSVLLIIVPLLMSALPEEMQKELQADKGEYSTGLL